MVFLFMNIHNHLSLKTEFTRDFVKYYRLTVKNSDVNLMAQRFLTHQYRYGAYYPQQILPHSRSNPYLEKASRKSKTFSLFDDGIEYRS